MGFGFTIFSVQVKIGVSLADMHIYVHWIRSSRIGVSLADICIYGSVRTHLLTLGPCTYHDVHESL